jgi:hypothetical protein
MNSIERPGFTLLSQFENIEVVIKVYEIKDAIIYDWDPYDDNNYGIYPDEGHLKWRFSITFNKDFKVCGLEFGKERTEYKEYIKDLVEKFKVEIDRVIRSEKTYSEKMVYLNEFNTKFSIVSDLYFIKEYTHPNFKQDFYYHNNTKIINDSANPIDDYALRYLLHNFFTIQKQSTSEILFYLGAKIDLLKEIGEYETSIKTQTKAKKSIEPLKVLDLHQTALLFSYLNDVGVIHYTSSNSIAPIVNELTGHSSQNIRTKAFDHIPDVKSGEAGNKIQTLKDPNINLKQVKDVVLKILAKVNEDLDKNEKNKSNKKL